MAEEAYVSMFIGDSSRPGSLDGLRVLLHSLRRHDARRPFVLMTVEPLRGEAAEGIARGGPGPAARGGAAAGGAELRRGHQDV